jgi:hypothetical protein
MGAVFHTIARSAEVALERLSNRRSMARTRAHEVPAARAILSRFYVIAKSRLDCIGDGTELRVPMTRAS